MFLLPAPIEVEKGPTLCLVDQTGSEEAGPDASTQPIPQAAVELEPVPMTMLDVLISTYALEDVSTVARELKEMGDIPLITRSALLGNESADRVLTNEAQKRRTVSRA